MLVLVEVAVLVADVEAVVVNVDVGVDVSVVVGDVMSQSLNAPLTCSSIILLMEAAVSEQAVASTKRSIEHETAGVMTAVGCQNV